MKLFLDDERAVPEGWCGVTTAYAAIHQLETGNVSELSLDHDLGDEVENGTGYDVLFWIESAIALEQFRPPEKIIVHSANSSARIKMELAIKQIYKLWEEYDK